MYRKFGNFSGNYFFDISNKEMFLVRRAVDEANSTNGDRAGVGDDRTDVCRRNANTATG